MESAAVTLIRGDLTGIGKAIHLSKAVMRNIELIFDSRFSIFGYFQQGGALSKPPSQFSILDSRFSIVFNPRSGAFQAFGVSPEWH